METSNPVCKDGIFNNRFGFNSEKEIATSIALLGSLGKATNITCKVNMQKCMKQGEIAL